MEIRITLTGDIQGELTGQQAWNWVENKRPYKGVPALEQLPNTKKDYRARNAAGGRRAEFQPSDAYKKKGHASSWFGFTDHYMERMKGKKRWELPDEPK